MNTSSGRCWSSEVYNPVPGVIEGIPPSNNYEGGFASGFYFYYEIWKKISIKQFYFLLGLMTKDLSLAQNASVETQSPTLLGIL